MKVLLVNSERGLRGGEHQTLELGLGLLRKGCKVCLAVPHKAPIIDRACGRIPVETFAFERVPIMTPLKLSRFIRRWKPDILHAQTSSAHTHLCIARVFLKEAPKLVVSRRVAFPVSRGISRIVKYRREDVYYIPISHAAAGSLEGAGVPDERMTIIPSGVEVDRFRESEGDSDLLESWGVGSGGLIIGTVAAFEPEKGYDVLLRAAETVLEDCPKCYFVFQGRGRLEGKLKGRIAARGLGERIILASPSNPLEDVLPLFDIFVLPSLKEGLSTALIAALAAGLPVVASDTGGIPEVTGEDCAVLVPPSDPRSLSEAILRLIASEDSRRRLAQSGPKRAERYDIKITVDRTLEVYNNLLAGDL